MNVTCERCGMQWRWNRRSDRQPPRTCPQCPRITTPESRSTRTSPHLTLALAVTNYRLAIEMATSLLELGRPAEALAALHEVEAPTRKEIAA